MVTWLCFLRNVCRYVCYLALETLKDMGVAGRQLYDEKNATKLTQKILNDRIVLPTTKGSAKLSIEFTSLLQGLLVKEPAKR